MKKLPPVAASVKRSSCLAAMFLGTALSALGSAAAASTVPAVDAANVVSHLSRYCNACWRNAGLAPDSWDDCTQEVLCRLLERVALNDWTDLLKDECEEKREFLRAIDAVKKRAQRERRGSELYPDSYADSKTGEANILEETRQAVFHAADRLLTPRQRSILQMSLQGWSVHEIATQLRVPPARISDEKYKAVIRLREHFQEELRSERKLRVGWRSGGVAECLKSQVVSNG